MQHRDIGYLLNRTARQFRLGLGEALTEIGIRPQQAAVIIAIDSSQFGYLTPSAVADAIGADAATTSGLLDRLVRDGWMIATPNPDDGRSRLFSLTGKAQQALPRIKETAEAVSADMTRCLSEAERATLVGMLQRICSGAHDASARAGAR